MDGASEEDHVPNTKQRVFHFHVGSSLMLVPGSWSFPAAEGLGPCVHSEFTASSRLWQVLRLHLRSLRSLRKRKKTTRPDQTSVGQFVTELCGDLNKLKQQETGLYIYT